jgi:hypothetical protein
MLLFTLIVFSGWAYNKLSGNDTVTGLASETSVDIGELESILEIGYGAAPVTVTFDTTWVEKHYAVKIWEWIETAEEIKTQRLTVTQEFQIKIGSSFSIAGNQVFLDAPQIISCETFPEREKITCTAAKVPPVLQKLVAIRCKAIAKAASRDRGDITLAALDIETRLVAKNVVVTWNK